MGPSVKIRRGSYSALSEDAPQGSQPRPLADIFTPQSPNVAARSASPVSPPKQLSSGSHLPEIPEVETSGRDTSRSPVRPRTRARAGSKVTHHVLNKASLRGMQGPAPSVSDGRRSRRSSVASRRTVSPPARSPQHMRMLEGPQAEVMINSDSREPGLIGSALSLPRSTTEPEESDSDSEESETDEDHHHDDIVEHLDVIDPQVATVSALTNAANSILIPPLSFYSRKPIVVLSSPARAPVDVEKGKEPKEDYEDPLDRHVDDILKRPSKFKRTMHGVWSFLKTPLGIVTGIYGFLVVFWGAAIVIFLVKIINFHNSNTQGFWIEVSSQVENGLFTLTGIGLIPPRLIDTYRVVKIWHYKRRTTKLRAQAGLPPLFDVDDLPDPAYDPNYVHVLSKAEQKDLHRQQERFQKHQTWYRPHGTETHRAFPINTALLICLLIDGNSFFQIILCGCMWGLNRFQRPPWTTGTLIPASFLCGIFSAVFISRGSSKTKRTKEVAERLRQALAAEHPDHYGDDSDDEGEERPPKPSKGEGVAPPDETHTPSDDTSNAKASHEKEVADEQMVVPSLP